MYGSVFVLTTSDGSTDPSAHSYIAYSTSFCLDGSLMSRDNVVLYMLCKEAAL